MTDAPDESKGPTKRRRFTADYKAGILAALEKADGRGAASALLRAEGLYWSHVAKWRRQREIGQLEDSWTEPWVRSQIQTLIEERAELMQEKQALAAQNARLRERLGQADQAEHPSKTGGSTGA